MWATFTEIPALSVNILIQHSDCVFSTSQPIERQTPLGLWFRSIRNVVDTGITGRQKHELKLHVRRRI
jgi:hypothetical protein